MAPRTPKDPEPKPVKSAKPAAKARPSAEKPVLQVVAPPEAEVTGGMMRLKDLVDAVAEATGAKKPEVKRSIEATLSAMGEALASGKALAVPPLGKLRVVKTKGPALTLKLRLSGSASGAGLALADDGEDS